MTRTSSNTNILTIGGHDPCGGAGIQADIETITNLGTNACSLIGCHTIQNTQTMSAHYASDAKIFRQQAEALLSDIDFSAIKIGVINSLDILHEVVNIINTLPDIPIVFDPVLAASHGEEFSNKTLSDALRNELIPLASIITPNHKELSCLTGINQPDTASEVLLAQGCKAILLTGTDASSDAIIQHQLFTQTEQHIYDCPRVAGEFHGSGCTLSSALATYLANGKSLHDAITLALEFTQQSIQRAKQTGKGQSIPLRNFQ